MATSVAQEIQKQETLVSFSIISYNTRFHVVTIVDLISGTQN
jgi:hypothetical protein